MSAGVPLKFHVQAEVVARLAELAARFTRERGELVTALDAGREAIDAGLDVLEKKPWHAAK